MSVLQSKNVDIVIDKNRTIDLYDEQITTNKQKSETNASSITSIDGRLTTAETTINILQNALKNISTGGGAGGSSYASLAEFTKLKNQVNNDLDPQVITNRQNISSANDSIKANTNSINTLKTNYNSLNSAIERLQQQQSTLDNSAQVTKIQNELNGLKTSYNNLESQVNMLDSAVSSTGEGLTSTIQKNSNNISSLTNRVSTLESTAKTNGNTVSGIQQTVNSHTSTLSSYKTNIDKNTQNISKLDTTLNSVSSNLTTLSTNFNTFQTNANKRFSEITSDFSKIKTALTPNQQSFTIAANSSQTLNFTGLDLFAKQISLYCQDSESGSRTQGKWINAEGVATIAIVSATQMIIYNDYDSALAFKLCVS